MKLLIQKATTSKRLRIFIADSSSTTGAGLTGLTNASGSLTAYYFRDGDSGTGTSISLVSATVGTWTSGGFIQISATNLPGWYEFDPPDAVFATGCNDVAIMLKGATNMAPCNIEIQLVSFDPNDVVRAGLTAFPNVATNNVGALLVSGVGTGALSVSGGVGNASLTQVDGTANASATLNLKRIVIANSASSPAVSITASGGSGDALFLTSANGKGINVVSTVDAAILATGSTYGLSVVGGTAGLGAYGNNTSAPGIQAIGYTPNGLGMDLQGQGTAAGLKAIGGATGHGINAVGGATSGNGITGTATTLGDGMKLTGAGTGGDGLECVAGGGVSINGSFTSTGFLVPKLIVNEVMDRPTSSTVVYEILIATYDETGTNEALDSAPTLTLVGSISGTSLIARMDSPTMTAVGGETGLYRSLYTCDAAHAEEQLRLGVTATEGAVARKFWATFKVRDLVSSRLATGGSLTLSGTQTFNMVGNITGNLSGSAGSVTGSVGSVTGNVGGNVAGSVGSVTGNVGGTVARVTLCDLTTLTSTLTTYTGNTVQTGDVYAKVGSLATGTMGGDIANLQTGVTAIGLKTAQMTFGVTNQLDANVKSWVAIAQDSIGGGNIKDFYNNNSSPTTVVVDDVGTGGGGGGTTDWDATERSQIRYRLGLDGTSAVPTATPHFGTITASLSGTQTFDLVGSITGNLIGNVTGTVASVTGSVGSVVSAVTMPDIGDDAFEEWASYLGASCFGNTPVWDDDGTPGHRVGTITSKDGDYSFDVDMDRTTLQRTTSNFVHP